MAGRRWLFGGGAADYVITIGAGNAATLAPATSTTFYSALTGGTQYTDLTTLAGGAVAAVTTDANGALPEFYGPPTDIRRMAADANGGAGPRRWIVATTVGGSEIDPTQPPYNLDWTGSGNAGPALKGLAQDMAAAGGGVARLRPGTFRATGSPDIPAGTGVHIRGAGWGATTLLYVGNTNPTDHLFNLDPPGLVNPAEDFELSGCMVDASDGIGFWGSNMVRSAITDNFLIHRTNTHPMVYVADATGPLGGTGGNPGGTLNNSTYMSENLFANKEQMAGGSRAYGMWYLDFSGTGLRCNDNHWDRGRGKIWTQPGPQWLTLIGDKTQNGSKGNWFTRLLFECSGGTGGFLWLQNVEHTHIVGLTSEDHASNTISHPLIRLSAYLVGGTPTGPGCAQCDITAYSRRSGTNINSGTPDILISGECDRILVDAPGQSSGGAALTINWGGATNCVARAPFPPGAVHLNRAGVTGP